MPSALEHGREVIRGQRRAVERRGTPERAPAGADVRLGERRRLLQLPAVDRRRAPGAAVVHDQHVVARCAAARTAPGTPRATRWPGSRDRPRWRPACRPPHPAPCAGSTRSRPARCPAPRRWDRARARGARTRAPASGSGGASSGPPADARRPPARRAAALPAAAAPRAAAAGNGRGDAPAGVYRELPARYPCAIMYPTHPAPGPAAPVTLGAVLRRLLRTRSPSRPPRGQDAQRRAHRQRRAALAGNLHRRRPDAAEREERRHLGQGAGPAARVLARRSQGAPQRPVPVPVDARSRPTARSSATRPRAASPG